MVCVIAQIWCLLKLNVHVYVCHVEVMIKRFFKIL